MLPQALTLLQKRDSDLALAAQIGQALLREVGEQREKNSSLHMEIAELRNALEQAST